MNRAPVPFEFDTRRLLTPIAGASPTGEPLRYEGTYDAIAALRREDDAQLDPGVWKTDLKKADWSRVAATCLTVLETRSKDLQIAGWLIEAWIQLHRFAGLREGLRAMAALCDTFWDGVHPMVQDGDLDYRLSPMFWVDDKLTMPIRLLPITNPESDRVPAFTLSDWEMACRTRARRDGDEAPALTLEGFEESAALTPAAWRAATARDIRGAVEAIDELRRVLDRRCGSDAPTLGRLRTALEDILTLDKSRGVEAEDETTAMRPEDGAMQADDGIADPVDEPADAAVGGERPIRTRAEAYRRLGEAADYLERTEPHSPVPRLVRRAIAWGGMSLEKVLAELVSDKGQLSEICRLLQAEDGGLK